jgi:hypothetical protein
MPCGRGARRSQKEPGGDDAANIPQINKVQSPAEHLSGFRFWLLKRSRMSQIKRLRGVRFCMQSVTPRGLKNTKEKLVRGERLDMLSLIPRNPTFGLDWTNSLVQTACYSQKITIHDDIICAVIYNIDRKIGQFKKAGGRYPLALYRIKMELIVPRDHNPPRWMSCALQLQRGAEHSLLGASRTQWRALR